MIYNFQIKNHLLKSKECCVGLNTETNEVYDKSDGYVLCSFDDFCKMYRETNGESFECIYSEEVSLASILECTKCKTIIFSSNDENFDPKLKCPHCTGYDTYFEWWSKKDIEDDPEKQKVIQTYRELDMMLREHDERVRRRGGKLDCEILKKDINTKYNRYEIVLECDNICYSYFKGLRFRIKVWKKEFHDDITCLSFQKNIEIPLSLSRIKVLHNYHKMMKEENQ